MQTAERVSVLWEDGSARGGENNPYAPFETGSVHRLKAVQTSNRAKQTEHMKTGRGNKDIPRRLAINLPNIKVIFGLVPSDSMIRYQ